MENKILAEDLTKGGANVERLLNSKKQDGRFGGYEF